MEAITLKHSPDEPGPPGEPPEVSETLGGWVWVVLFGMVMAFSIMANVMLCCLVLPNKRKHNVVYAFLLALFGLNLVDYGLLIFDFSLGLDHQYPHQEGACQVYQAVSKGNPIIQAVIIVLMVFYAAFHYNASSSNSCSRYDVVAFLGLSLAALMVLYGLLALPTVTFAKIVGDTDGKRYCEIDLDFTPNKQRDISLYYLVYSSILSYWLPLLVCVPPMIRLAKLTNNDKYPEVTVVLATASSFFIFYLLYASIVLVRHSMDAMGMVLDDHHSWMIKVAQSLLCLVAFFWHATRPLLAILMDHDLQAKGCTCCLPLLGTSYDLVEEARSARLTVVLSPKEETTKGSCTTTLEETTSLNSDLEPTCTV